MKNLSNQKLTGEGIKFVIDRIKIAYPSLEKGFFEILIDRLKANDFTDYLFFKAANNVIDTCQYPAPTIADFIKYHKKEEIPTATIPENLHPSQKWIFEKKNNG
jgi:hypothetical protein